jgi:hypothetical protein
MSDERLRELERRWKGTGSVEEEAAWLRERVRVGEVPVARVRIAASLGHAASRRGLGVEAPPEFNVDEDARDETSCFWTRLGAVLRQVCREAGRDAGVRAAITCARPVLPLWLSKFPQMTEPEAALIAAEAWCISVSSTASIGRPH